MNGSRDHSHTISSFTVHSPTFPAKPKFGVQRHPTFSIIVEFSSTGTSAKKRSSVFLADDVVANVPATWRQRLLVSPLGVGGAEDQVVSIVIVPSVGSSFCGWFFLSYLNKSSSARKDLMRSRMRSASQCAKSPWALLVATSLRDCRSAILGQRTVRQQTKNNVVGPTSACHEKKQVANVTNNNKQSGWAKRSLP